MVLDTGLTKEQVGKVILSFLGHYQDQVTERPVYIPGFGEMASEIKSRRYWDVNKGVPNEYARSFKPKIRFTPSEQFLTLVRHTKET